MRTWNHLYDQLLDPETLDAAAVLTVRGKRHRSDVAWFLFRREEELARLHAGLADGSWRPDGFSLVRVRDPKPRVIGRSTIADRVVHTALVKVMEPALLTSLRPECFACRPGLGTHRAAVHLLRSMRRHRYFLHLDVRAYFPSVDLGILRALLRRRIHDERFLGVIDRVIDAGADIYQAEWVRRWLRLPTIRPGTGLPVGAYTSQVLASWLYLDAYDHLATRTWKVPGYLRYVDDIFLFGDSVATLEEQRAATVTWMDVERKLLLKHPRAHVRSCRETMHALGFAINRDGLGPLPRLRRKMKKKLAGWVWGHGGGRDRLVRSLTSLLGNTTC